MYFDFAEASERAVYIATLDRIVRYTIRRWHMKMECQAEKGVGWMPRGQRPKKGAENGET